MKTTLLTTAIIVTGMGVISSTATGQVIPNYNFETWSNGANSPPDGWEDHGSNHTGFYPTTKTTDKHLGTYAVRLENKITSTDTTKAILSTVRPNNKEGFGPAFPIAVRYNNLKGFYKYTPQNGDSAEIIVFITKTGYVNKQGWGDLLAWGQIHLGAASVYTPFSAGYLDSLVNFYYDDNAAVPDSAYIEMGAYKMVGTTPGAETKPLGNSVLYIDALNFDSYLSGINEHLDVTTNFKLFPNANNGAFDVSFGTAASDYTTIKIYDLNGREVMNLLSENMNAGDHTFHYNVKNLPNGNYLFVVATEDGYKAEKICIQK